MICVPLRSKLRVLGVIQLVNVDMERFKEPELFFLQSLCDYLRGQTSSLQAGLRALMNAELEAILLCLVDHPAVSSEVMKKLLASLRESGAPVVIPIFKGKKGHPIVISRVLFQELLDLGSDQGANTVIQKYRDSTCFTEVSEEGILLDVDEPETYRRL